MSTSDFYTLNEKSTTHLAEFRNGWGSAPICWDHLGSKYIAEKPIYGMDGEHLKKVWALASDKRLARHEKVALMMTFDKAYIPLANLEDAADCCERFGKDCEDGRNVNHWPSFAKSLREIAAQKHNRHTRGVVLSCTSVSDMWGDPSDDYLENAWSVFAEECLTQ